jgi:hypothetical protein
MELPAFDCLSQRFARREQMLLTDELIERTRPHPVGERAQGGRGSLR